MDKIMIFGCVISSDTVADDRGGRANRHCAEEWAGSFENRPELEELIPTVAVQDELYKYTPV